MEQPQKKQKPTRIIEAPRYVIGVNNRPCLLYSCDDGNEYVSTELAAIIGIGRDMLSKRCHSYGWNSPQVFQAPDLTRIEKIAAIRARKRMEVMENNGGNAEWMKLGKEKRDHNLKRMPRPGIFERQMEGSYCAATCRGTMPLELTLISIADLGGEKIIENKIDKEEMMATTRKTGVCDLCGKTGGQVLVDGKKCCSLCEHIRRNAKLRPALIMEQLREFHSGLLAGYLDELLNLHPELRSAVSEIPTVVDEDLERWKNIADAQKRHLEALASEKNELVIDNVKLADKITELRARNERMRCGNHEEYPLPPPMTDTKLAITDVCDSLRSLLIEKNNAYGNSALDPVRIFSRASAMEQILIRIDDKLSRLSKGSEYPGDDTIMDLAGYMVLLLVHRAIGPLNVAA